MRNSHNGLNDKPKKRYEKRLITAFGIFTFSLLFVNYNVYSLQNASVPSNSKKKSNNNVFNHNEKSGKHISNETEIIINREISEVYRWVIYEPLEIQLPGTKKLPGVISTKAINTIKLGDVGHRRIVYLADKNTAIEEHTYIEKNKADKSEWYFSYKVSDYTLKIAQNIDYATGEWWFTPMGDNKTHIKWRYTFVLNKNKILGRLGFFGRFLFKNFFIKTRYNEFMVVTLNKLKIDLEK